MVVGTEHDILLDLPEQGPAVLYVIRVLVAHVHSADKMVAVTATRRSYAHVSVVVAPAYHAWLVGNTDTPCVVVVPERLLRYMPRLGVFLVLQVSVREIFPCVAVLCLVLEGDSSVKASLLEGSDANHEMVGGLSLRRNTKQH